MLFPIILFSFRTKFTYMVNDLPNGIRAQDEFKSFIELIGSQQISAKVIGNYYRVKYIVNGNREGDLIDFILNSLVSYSLKKSESSQLNIYNAKKIVAKGIDRYVHNKSIKKFKGGELGEVFLFHFLEVFENAVQIVNKMSLKTSNDMYYHGSDAIHFGINNGVRCLFFGESKIGNCYNGAFHSAIKSIKDYHTSGKSDIDVNLAMEYPSDYIPDELFAEIKDFLNPLTSDLTNFAKVYAIFVGYENKKLLDLESKYSGKELLSAVSSLFDDITDIYLKSIEQNVINNPDFNGLILQFYILPFKDLAQMRKYFYKYTGSYDTEIPII